MDRSGNPDLYVINTCSVTSKSEHQSRQLIRKALKTGAKVIATGCYAQLRPEELSKIEGLDVIIGNSEKKNILDFIKDLSEKPEKTGSTSITVNSPSFPLNSQPYYSNRSRAFLKIQDGCNFSCTYCAVPSARGKSRSLSLQNILSSVGRLENDGYEEIVLTGIHIGSYGLELNPQSSLLEIVDKITSSYPGIRIRLSSLEPRELKVEFLTLIKERNVCPHLHIPLQSGSDNILKAMNRGYSTIYYEHLINTITAVCPDISIGTDLITGFPGETDNDFDQTVKFISKLPITYMHVFPYSRRPGTKASVLSNHVTEMIKKERVHRLLEIGKLKKYAYMKRHLGCLLDVIVEKKSVTGRYYTAISDNYLRVLVKSGNLTSGKRIKVEVISLTDEGLEAKPLK